MAARYEYKVEEIREGMLGGKMSGDKLERVLNDIAGDGWQLKANTAVEGKGRVGPGGVEGVLVTVERPVGCRRAGRRRRRRTVACRPPGRRLPDRRARLLRRAADDPPGGDAGPVAGERSAHRLVAGRAPGGVRLVRQGGPRPGGGSPAALPQLGRQAAAGRPVGDPAPTPARLRSPRPPVARAGGVRLAASAALHERTEGAAAHGGAPGGADRGVGL